MRLANALAVAYGVDPADVGSSYVGPRGGADVTSKALRGLFTFLVLVSLVLTVYFRDWRMAMAGLIALVHDVLITVGVYATVGWEVTPATVIGFLTILGFSLYDTVVVFDKVRENVDGALKQKRYTYGELANLALNQTLVRSINTSVVAVLPVAAILFIGSFLLGAGTLRDIALALFVGILVGTYSSVFLATPLLVWMRERDSEVAAHNASVLAARAARVASGEPEPVHVGSLARARTWATGLSRVASRNGHPAGGHDLRVQRGPGRAGGGPHPEGARMRAAARAPGPRWTGGHGRQTGGRCSLRRG